MENLKVLLRNGPLCILPGNFTQSLHLTGANLLDSHCKFYYNVTVRSVINVLYSNCTVTGGCPKKVPEFLTDKNILVFYLTFKLT